MEFRISQNLITDVLVLLLDYIIVFSVLSILLLDYVTVVFVLSTRLQGKK